MSGSHHKPPALPEVSDSENGFSATEVRHTEGNHSKQDGQIYPSKVGVGEVSGILHGSAGILPAPFGILPNGFSPFGFDLSGKDAGECRLEARAPPPGQMRFDDAAIEGFGGRS